MKKIENQEQFFYGKELIFKNFDSNTGFENEIEEEKAKKQSPEKSIVLPIVLAELIRQRER